MINIPNEIKELIKKYENRYKEKPRGWNFKEENLSEYREYLQKELYK